MSDVQIKGFAELQKALETLPAKIEANIMRGALRAGAVVIKKEIAQNVPVQTATLKQGLKIKTRNKKGFVTATIRTAGKHGFVARFLEFGVATHEIKAKDGSSLFFGSIFVDKVTHPGISPKPFMRPAFDRSTNEAIQAVGKYIGKRLTKQGIETPDIEVDT